MKNLCGLLLMITLVSFGCSSSGYHDPSTPNPVSSVERDSTVAGLHNNWGLWQFIANPKEKTLDVIQLRTGQMHLNALDFVDQPIGVYLTVEDIVFNGNKIDVDVGLRHPFIGLDKYTGFDVKGILISDGGLGGFTDPDLQMPGPDDTRLLNADGMTRWWNPVEFPDNGTVYGYSDGVLGTPNSIAGYTATINDYKYFCDDLGGANDPLSLVDPEGRGVFSAGVKNTRHYTIQLGSGGLVFNYAVDASWKLPVGSPPYQVPDSFPANANQPEAYRVEVTQLPGSTVFYDVNTMSGGGDLNLSINVYDWFNAGLNTVYAEWPGFASQVISAIPSGSGTGYSTYDIDLISCTPSGVGDQPVLITVGSDVNGYGGLLPGKKVSSYFIFTADVPPGGGQVDPPDICSGWGNETGNYWMYPGSTLNDIYTQFNLASDSNGNVWMWCHRTGNALSRCSTAFNGDWGNMYEANLYDNYEIFYGSTLDVSLTTTFDGGLIAGCSPQGWDPSSHPNYLSLAWWDGASWHEGPSGAWIVATPTNSTEEANRINGYRDSTGRFHAFCQINGQLVDYYGDTWGGAWSQVVVAPMPPGQLDFACQTRTDFVTETSNGWIYLCWVDNGIKVARCQAGTTTWNIVDQFGDANYDSPTIYADNQNKIFVATRYFVSTSQDQITLFSSINGTDFTGPTTIFTEANTRVDPCYLALKGDADDNLFLTFPYRPGSSGAYAAIMAGNPGGTLWTAKCVLSVNPLIKHPALAVRPDGSIEVCYGLCDYPYAGAEEGGTDTPFSERNLIYGKSNPGFQN